MKVGANALTEELDRVADFLTQRQEGFLFSSENAQRF